MRKITGIVITLATVAGLCFAPVAKAEDASAQAAYADIQKTLGSVPGFFKAFPESGIAGAWAEFKSVQLNPKTKLDAQTKELIGLAVAAQIPCQYCIYFHTAVAKANGATDQQIGEAVAMAESRGTGARCSMACRSISPPSRAKPTRCCVRPAKRPRPPE